MIMPKLQKLEDVATAAAEWYKVTAEPPKNELDQAVADYGRARLGLALEEAGLLDKRAESVA